MGRGRGAHTAMLLVILAIKRNTAPPFSSTISGFPGAKNISPTVMPFACPVVITQTTSAKHVRSRTGLPIASSHLMLSEPFHASASEITRNIPNPMNLPVPSVSQDDENTPMIADTAAPATQH